MTLVERGHRLLDFRYLRTRLTVLYLGLFGLALTISAIAVVTAVSASAKGVVREEMRASGAVYDQLWKARSAQLSQGAGVLAQDYGFREAVAGFLARERPAIAFEAQALAESLPFRARN